MQNFNSYLTSTSITFILGFSIGLLSSTIFIMLFDKKKSNPKVSNDGDHVEYTSSDAVGEMKMVLVVRNDLKMGKGKVAAQCSHAAVMAHEEASRKCMPVLREWKKFGQRKIVVKADSEQELLKLAKDAKHLGLISAVVRDAGLTQIEPNTRTVLAIGPAPSHQVDAITGHLKLL